MKKIMINNLKKWMPLILIILFISIYIYLFAFNDFYNKIEEEIEKQIKKKEMQLDLKEVFSFDWDEFYIFNYNVREQELNEIIGEVDLNKVDIYEFHEKIMFLNKKKIVFFENYEINISERSDKTVYFRGNYNNYHYTTNKSNIYTIKISEHEGKPYYILNLKDNN